MKHKCSGCVWGRVVCDADADDGHFTTVVCSRGTCIKDSASEVKGQATHHSPTLHGINNNNAK